MSGKVARAQGISSVEECAGLVELTRTQERVLIDCFKALDGGATNEELFDRYPQRAESLRGYVDLRDQLLAQRAAVPSPVAFASGREALLARVIRPLANGHPGSTGAQVHQARGLFWRPAARVGVAGALLFAMAGCALGVSATAGGDRLGNLLPPIPTMRAPYPFPKLNDAQDALPTAQPQQPSSDGTNDAAPDPQATAEPPGGPQDTNGAVDDSAKPTKADPAQGWLPPQTAHETDTPEDVATPSPTNVDDAAVTPTQDDGLPTPDAATPAADGSTDTKGDTSSHDATRPSDQSSNGNGRSG